MNHEVTPEGVIVDGTRVFVEINAHGHLRSMTRSLPDRATFSAMAVSAGLLKLDENGRLRSTRGVTVTEIGPMVITPGEYAEDGTVIIPPVMDTRHHADFWLHRDLVAKGAWGSWALDWTLNGMDVPANAEEVAKEKAGIQLIDPATVRSRSLKLAGDA